MSFNTSAASTSDTWTGAERFLLGFLFSGLNWGGTFLYPTFTLGWLAGGIWVTFSTALGLVFLLAPSSFLFNLVVGFITVVTRDVSSLQDSLRVGCCTYEGHQTCRLCCPNLHGSYTHANQALSTVEGCTECCLDSVWCGKTCSLISIVWDSLDASQVVLLLRASCYSFLWWWVVFKCVSFLQITENGVC